MDKNVNKTKHLEPGKAFENIQRFDECFLSNDKPVWTNKESRASALTAVPLRNDLKLTEKRYLQKKPDAVRPMVRRKILQTTIGRCFCSPKVDNNALTELWGELETLGERCTVTRAIAIAAKVSSKYTH